MNFPSDGQAHRITFEDITDGTCLLEQDVDLEPCSFVPLPSIYIPNVFNINAEGGNDNWEIFSTYEEIQFIECYVYDRWGNVQFFSDNPASIIWDGTSDGEEYKHIDRWSLKSIIDELQPNKKENLITIFPDCGEGFGKVYYINAYREAINLDNYFELEQMTGGSYDLLRQLESLKGNEFDTQYLDTIQEGIRQLDWSQIQQAPKIQIDSIFDLFPQQWSISPVKETLLEN